MKRPLFHRTMVCVVVVALAAGALNGYAEPLRNPEALRHEAFLRGGAAISEALNEPATERPLVASSLLPAAPPPEAVPAPPQEGSGRKALLWVGIGVTATIAVYLVQRSVRNHGKIFGDTQ